MALVSVIVPVYNVEKYLTQCLNSLADQSLKEIEIICVNDGSTDHSSQILDAFSARDHRIKVISKKNSGYGDSMNAGLAKAESEYIGIVESDDHALPDMFMNLLQEAKRKNADVVKSNYYSCSERDGRKYEEILADIPYHTSFCPQDDINIWRVPPSIWSGLYKKEFLEKQQILFHASQGASYQDVSFWYKVLLSAERMVCVPEAYLCYRSDNENSSVRSPKKVFCIMDEFDVIREYIRDRHKESMLPLIVREQFIHYMGNYDRIDPLYQYAFLERAKEELRQDYSSGLMVRSLWSGEYWNLMRQIIEDPDTFFESTNIDYLNRYKHKPYTVNHTFPDIGAKNIIDNAEKIIIYGAGIYGQRLLNRFSDRKKIIGFAVTELKKGMPERISGIPVYEISQLKEHHSDALVITAIKKSKQMPVLHILKKYGFDSVLSVDKI